jgi:hypothetical protein
MKAAVDMSNPCAAFCCTALLRNVVGVEADGVATWTAAIAIDVARYCVMPTVGMNREIVGSIAPFGLRRTS